MLKMLMFFSLFLNLAYAQGDFKADALKSWQGRDEEKNLKDALSNFEKAHKAAPQDIEVLTYLSRGYFLLAEYFVSDKSSKMDTFEKAKDFGTKALMLNPVYKKVSESDPLMAIDEVTEKEVAPLYWRAVALGKWSKLNGVLKSLKFKDEILASVRRVEKLKPDFFYASVPRYMGSFYALAPGIAGGSMTKSKDEFKKAMKEAPEYLGTKTLYAEYYLVEEDEEKEFKKVLKEVIDAPVGPEEIAAENRLEKKRAQKLLDKVKDLF